jgi:hypothetical protein
MGSSPLSFSALSPSPSLVGLSLDQFCSKSPQSSKSFDHFLELRVYAKRFIFGGLFIKKNSQEERRRSKRKEDEEERRRREEEVVSRVL